MMTESVIAVIAGDELKLTARIEEDGALSISWDKMEKRFLFHDGYAAMLRRGSSDTENMVELQRVRVDVEPESGHVEHLLSD